MVFAGRSVSEAATAFDPWRRNSDSAGLAMDEVAWLISSASNCHRFPAESEFRRHGLQAIAASLTSTFNVAKMTQGSCNSSVTSKLELGATYASFPFYPHAERHSSPRAGHSLRL